MSLSESLPVSLPAGHRLSLAQRVLLHLCWLITELGGSSVPQRQQNHQQGHSKVASPLVSPGDHGMGAASRFAGAQLLVGYSFGWHLLQVPIPDESRDAPHPLGMSLHPSHSDTAPGEAVRGWGVSEHALFSTQPHAGWGEQRWRPGSAREEL